MKVCHAPVGSARNARVPPAAWVGNQGGRLQARDSASRCCCDSLSRAGTLDAHHLSYEPTRQSSAPPYSSRFLVAAQVKGSMKAAGWGHVQQAVKYDDWQTSRRQDSRVQRWARVAGNEWLQRQNASIIAAHNR